MMVNHNLIILYKDYMQRSIQWRAIIYTFMDRIVLYILTFYQSLMVLGIVGALPQSISARYIPISRKV